MYYNKSGVFLLYSTYTIFKVKMDFKSIVKCSSLLYKILEKINLEKKIDVDSILDNNFPQVQSRLQSYIKNQKTAKKQPSNF